MNETNLNFRTLRDPANAKRDWTEDAGHENGNYLCQCLLCGKEFIGHKRRTVCKLCDGATSIK